MSIKHTRLSTGEYCPFCGAPVYRLVDEDEYEPMRYNRVTVGFECSKGHPLTYPDLDPK